MCGTWDGLRKTGSFLAIAAGLTVGQSALAECANATYVLEGTHHGVNQGAGLNSSGICSNPELGGDAWFQYTAPEDGILNVAVRGKQARHVISIWEGCPQRDGAGLVCREDGAQRLSTVAGATVLADHDYLIRVSNLSDHGDDFALDIDILPNDQTAAGGDRAPGPDVVYQNINQVSRFGPVGDIYAFIFDTSTCNVGTQNLHWGGSWQGSPSVGFNVYRHKDGRLTQIGQGFCKQACCAAAGGGCGLSCNGAGGSVLGAGCLDFYDAGWNSQQSALAPRSILNAWTGAHQIATGGTGNAIFKRTQVHRNDLDTALNPNAFYFVEGVYVANDDAPVGNHFNNASYRRVTVTNFNLTPTGTMFARVPAITAWRGIDPTVVDGIVDVPSEGRFHTAYKVTDLGGGNFRYDYAIFNLNSDRSGGSFSVPIPAGTNVTNVGFSDVLYHSGEPYDNTDWVSSVGASSVTWSSPQTFVQNPNSNALRWGTMYNFWFEANRGPTTGPATLGLFKPHTPQSVQFDVAVPSGPALLPGDLNCDGLVTVADIGPFVMAVTDPAGYAATFPGCNILNGDTNGDGFVTVADIGGFVALVTGA